MWFVFLVLIGVIVLLVYRAGRRHGRDDVLLAATDVDRMQAAVEDAAELLTKRALEHACGTEPTPRRVADLSLPALWHASILVAGADETDEALYHKVFSTVINRRTTARRATGNPEKSNLQVEVAAQDGRRDHDGRGGKEPRDVRPRRHGQRRIQVTWNRRWVVTAHRGRRGRPRLRRPRPPRQSGGLPLPSSGAG